MQERRLRLVVSQHNFRRTITIELRPIIIETGSPDQEGRLVLAKGRLIALAVKLEDSHLELAESWSLEWIAGSALTLPAPFENLAEAEAWLAEHVTLTDIY